MLGKLFRRKPTLTLRAELAPSGHVFDISSRQRLLDAALDQGIDFPYSCRVGGCGTCRCRLVDGQVKEHTDTSYLFSAEEIGRGYILACQSSPMTDVRIEVEGVGGGASLPDRVKCTGEVRGLEHLTHDIVRLTVELERPVDYRSGQYANLSVPGVVVQPRSYSFSCAPGERANAQHAIFDIRILANGAFSGWLNGEAAPGAALEFEGPNGSFRLHPSGAPILAVAGGTGLGPILAILQELRRNDLARDVTLLLGARQERDLYGLDALHDLKRRFPARLDVWPVLSEQGEDWSGRTGMVTEHINDVARLSEHHGYLCGPPPMIDAALPILSTAGVNEVFFDKFLDTSG